MIGLPSEKQHWIQEKSMHIAKHASRAGFKTGARLSMILLAMAAAGVHGTAIAQGAVGQVLITGIAIDTHDANMAFISVNRAKNDNPACSTSSWAFALPLTTPLQNLMFSELLAARTNQTPVSLGGSGLCDIYASVETLTFVNY
jgi:hypothetical protein